MKVIERDFRVPASHPSLAAHFPGNPIVPGVVLLDHVLRLLQHETGARVTGMRQVKFLSVVRPEERLVARCELEGAHARFRLLAQRDRQAETVASGDLLFGATAGSDP